MGYNDYKYVLIIKTENDNNEAVTKEVRMSLEQVKVILTDKQLNFVNINGWVTTGKTLIEKRAWSINELDKKFPTLEISHA